MPATGGSVAKEVLSYCTSCKIDLQHIVVAMKGDKVAKVQCKTCKKEHAFRAPKGVTEPPPKKKKKSAEPAAQARSISAEWEKLMAEKKAAPTRNYNAKTIFALGDKLTHPSFGDGIVGRLIYPNKVEVIFRNDVKILIHGATVERHAAG